MYRKVKKELKKQAYSKVPSYSASNFECFSQKKEVKYVEKIHRIKLIPILVGLFCLIVVMTLIPGLIENSKILIEKNSTRENINQTTETIAATMNSALGFIPEWDNREVYDQFNTIEYNADKYLSPNDLKSCVTTQSIEIELTQEQVTAIDQNTGDSYSINIRIYKLINISIDCAIGVKFEGQEVIYPYLSLNYCPKTLGIMMDDIDLKNTVKFNNICYDGKNYVVDTEIIYNFLESFSELSSVGDKFYTPIVDINIDCPALGKYNHAITLSSEGYLEINLFNGDAGTCCFYIGEDAVKEFIANLQELTK